MCAVSELHCVLLLLFHCFILFIIIVVFVFTSMLSFKSSFCLMLVCVFNLVPRCFHESAELNLVVGHTGTITYLCP